VPLYQDHVGFAVRGNLTHTQFQKLELHGGAGRQRGALRKIWSLYALHHPIVDLDSGGASPKKNKSRCFSTVANNLVGASCELECACIHRDSDEWGGVAREYVVAIPERPHLMGVLQNLEVSFLCWRKLLPREFPRA